MEFEKDERGATLIVKSAARVPEGRPRAKGALASRLVYNIGPRVPMLYNGGIANRRSTYHWIL